MFKVFVNDGEEEMPKDDIVYIVCKEGVYLKKKAGIMESITPVKGLAHLESVEKMAKMHIKKIPGYPFAKIVDFFRAVYVEHKSEAVVLIFYDMETDEYEFVIPPQKVSGASADYVKGFSIEGMDMIGTAHCHAGMSAYHSGVDDKDEESFDGIHITIGDMDKESFSISASIVSNGTRFIVDPEEYIKDIIKVVDVDEEVNKPYSKVFRMVDGKLVESKVSHVYSYRKFDKRYNSKFLKASLEPQGLFDKEWLDKVEHKVQTFAGFGNAWGGAFDASYWQKKWSKDPLVSKDALKTPDAVKTAPKSKPEIPVKGEMNPCMECVFKAHKIDWVMEQIAAGVQIDEGPDLNNFIPGPDDMPLLDTYHCEQCESVFQTDDLEAVCPICKTDDHMVDVTGEIDLDDESILDADFSHMDEAGSFENGLLECSECAGAFQYNGGQDTCPYCNSPIIKFGEEERQDQFKADSGDFLGEDTEAIMKAAEAADREVERLPIPGQNEIPIKDTKPGVFSFMRIKRNKKGKKKK